MEQGRLSSTATSLYPTPQTSPASSAASDCEKSPRSGSKAGSIQPAAVQPPSAGEIIKAAPTPPHTPPLDKEASARSTALAKLKDASTESPASPKPAPDLPAAVECETIAASPVMERVAEDERRCRLCLDCGDMEGSEGGRLLPMPPDGWAHVNCLLWSAEVYEGDDGALHNAQAAVKRGRLMRCSMCGDSGATVGCCHRGCSRNYHFACAIDDHATFMEKEVFCEAHSGGRSSKTLNYDIARRVFASSPMFRMLSDGGLEDFRPDTHIDAEASYVRMGSLCVLALGMVAWQRPGFHTRTSLHTIGYTAVRTYWSAVTPGQRRLYLCRIEEMEDEPLFTIVSEDGLRVSARSPEAAWTAIFDRVKAAWSSEAWQTPPDGRYMFGLALPPVIRWVPSHLAVADGAATTLRSPRVACFASPPFSRCPSASSSLLEKLPGAGRCKRYVFKFERPRPEDLRHRLLPVNPSGCARGEAYSKQRVHSLGGSSKQSSSGGASRQQQQQQQAAPAFCSDLNTTMQYRRSKQFLDSTVSIKHSRIQGCGLFAKRTIMKNEFIIEYVGEVIRPALTDKREQYYDSKVRRETALLRFARPGKPPVAYPPPPAMRNARTLAATCFVSTTTRWWTPR